MKIYHIFSRGVEKRNIFLDNVDRVRFIHDMYEFNDTAYAPPFSRRNINKYQKAKERTRIINIHAFCLMPNHHHLLCEEIKEGGMSLFIKKLHGGYARAFNEKYKRSGYLFQGKYKRISINANSQLLQVTCYIHANPLDLWRSNWKEKMLTKKEIEKALEFLENYRWSSHPDYLGKKNFSSVIEKKFLEGIFGEYGSYKKFFKKWLEFYEKNFQEVKECTFE